jgi:hypothetical protein
MAPAQAIIFDKGHFTAVGENAAAREAAEAAHHSYLSTIHDQLNDINLNISAVALVQQMIKSSLSQVDAALKSGQTLMQIGQISEEIITEGGNMIAQARSDPLLLLFARQAARQLKARGINLVTEVSGFILRGGDKVLMDFEKRDALLSNVVNELKVMRALAYSINRSMYWARQNGLWKTSNPFGDFVNRDIRLTDAIIFNAHFKN